MENEWEWVPGYSGRYRVSIDGVVVSENAYGHDGKTKEVSQWANPRGYKYVTLFRDGEKKHFQVHRLVLSAFDRIPAPFEEVNHINGIHGDNRFENLEWCYHDGNMKHAVDTGLRKTTINTGKKYTWGHVDGDKFYGTAMELSRAFAGLNWKSLYEVSGGKKRSNRGWMIMEAER